MYTAIKNVIQSITRALGYVGMVFIIPMMLLTSADATARDLFSKPIPGAFEVSSLLLSILILLGLAYAHQMRDHVRVTMLVDRLPVKMGAVLTIFTTLLSMFVIGVMCWQGLVLTLELKAQVSDMLRIPQWPFRLLVCVGGLFLFLELFFDLIDSARRLAE
jgi:TRAP-type C4-dicarboxylate transport system permease small subunit